MTEAEARIAELRLAIAVCRAEQKRVGSMPAGAIETLIQRLSDRMYWLEDAGILELVGTK